MMKAVEFPSQLNPDQTLHVPENVVNSIPRGQSLRVLVLIPDDAEERDWVQQATNEFGKGYADGDAIYDRFSTR